MILFRVSRRVKRYYENLDIAGLSLTEIEHELEDINRLADSYMDRGLFKLI